MSLSSIFKHRLFENFVSLGAIQALNYILPLITVPFLFNQLGVTNYGVINFGFSYTLYFIIITEFGFGLAGTRFISAHIGKTKKINEYFSSVFFCQMLLLFASFILFYIGLNVIESCREYKDVYIWFFGMVIGTTITPIWYFQGIEKMKYITLISIITRTLSIVPLFIIVREPEDFKFIPICYSAGSIGAGIITLSFLLKKFDLRILRPNLKTIFKVFVDGSHYFLSRFSVSLFTNTNMFVLGLVSSPEIVGYYAIAEKIYNAVNSIYAPINGAIFPYMTKTKDLELFKKILQKGVLFNLLFVASVAIIFPYVAPYFFKNIPDQSLLVLRIFLVSCIFSLPATFLGYPFLAAWGHPNYTNYSLVIISIQHILLLGVLYLTHSISIYTVALLVVLCELSLLTIRVNGVIKYKIWN